MGSERASILFQPFELLVADLGEAGGFEAGFEIRTLIRPMKCTLA
jgi:hypothetical protein